MDSSTSHSYAQIDMINFEEAKLLAEQRIKEYMSYDDSLTLILLEDETIYEDFGWIFFYNSKEFVETGDMSYALGGNAPLLVDKNVGQVFETGTAMPIEEYIKSYRQHHH